MLPLPLRLVALMVTLPVVVSVVVMPLFKVRSVAVRDTAPAALMPTVPSRVPTVSAVLSKKVKPLKPLAAKVLMALLALSSVTLPPIRRRLLAFTKPLTPSVTSPLPCKVMVLLPVDVNPAASVMSSAKILMAPAMLVGLLMVIASVFPCFPRFRPVNVELIAKKSLPMPWPKEASLGSKVKTPVPLMAGLVPRFQLTVSDRTVTLPEPGFTVTWSRFTRPLPLASPSPHKTTLPLLVLIVFADVLAFVLMLPLALTRIWAPLAVLVRPLLRVMLLPIKEMGPAILFCRGAARLAGCQKSDGLCPKCWKS